MKRIKSIPVGDCCSVPKSVMMMKLASGLIYAVTGVLLVFWQPMTVEIALAIYLVVKGLKKMIMCC